MGIYWEIIRYKCQIKGTNNRWETLKVCYQEEEAEKWLRAGATVNGHPVRVVKEEAMRIE